MTFSDATGVPDRAACPGCGLRTPGAGGAPPGAPAGCRERYGELLARSYRSEVYRGVHQLIVDAYVAQHPAGKARREIQAVALCLMTLCLFIEHDADPRQGPTLHKRMMANRPDFHWLQPPPLHGLVTVADVLGASTPDEHEKLAWAWSRDVWQAWAPHHPTIREWNTSALPSP